MDDHSVEVVGCQSLPRPSSSSCGGDVHAMDSAKSLVALPSNIDSQLLRATPVHVMLAGFGKHLKTNAATESDYNFSVGVSEIDDFVSHEWGTPRIAKVMALLVLYNHKDAAHASALLALPLAFVGLHAGRFDGARIGCPLIWALVLCFGQRLKSFAGDCRYVFLDKLCIHQTDTDKKAAGILGLAGFLRVSKRLVVLWSPRYFSRLWCTYELAAWSYLHGTEARPVKFIPVHAAMFFVEFTTMLVVKSALQRTLAWVLDGKGFTLYVLGHSLVVVAVIPLLVRTCWLIRDLGEIEADVRDYNMRDAKCYCCTQDHVHPESGMHLPCDRRLVYKTLLEWWTKTSHDDLAMMRRGSRLSNFDGFACDMAVATFNEEVRSNLLRVLRRTSSSFVVFCSYGDIVCATVPACWDGSDQVLLLVKQGAYADSVRVASEYISLWLFVYPLTLLMTWHFGSWLYRFARDRLRDTRYECCLELLLLSAVSTVCIAIFHMLWLPGFLLTPLNEKSPLPGIKDLPLILRFTLLALATVGAAKSGSCRRSLEKLQTEVPRFSVRSRSTDSMCSARAPDIESTWNSLSSAASAASCRHDSKPSSPTSASGCRLFYL
eukprot:TRINITY_DN35508_c0_g1_i1.p1 TRINITY_DN35508_c0_g1~~TRINITY_DN35508_c0_g1_i1.p1  ORF type:complete len:604 (-),score=39.81 TRINITY_DN35508_c0_g1_i1:230-2041(-)